MNFAIDFAPHMPLACCGCWARPARSWRLRSDRRCARAAPGLRAACFCVRSAALANPLIVHETREPLADIVALSSIIRPA